MDNKEYICSYCKSKIHIDCNYYPVCGEEMKGLEKRNLTNVEGLINIFLVLYILLNCFRSSNIIFFT